jgi:hypothetical protein
MTPQQIKGPLHAPDRLRRHLVPVRLDLFICAKDLFVFFEAKQRQSTARTKSEANQINRIN